MADRSSSSTADDSACSTAAQAYYSFDASQSPLTPAGSADSLAGAAGGYEPMTALPLQTLPPRQDAVLLPPLPTCT
jgi:hypothetical protein